MGVLDEFAGLMAVSYNAHAFIDAIVDTRDDRKSRMKHIKRLVAASAIACA